MGNLGRFPWGKPDVTVGLPNLWYVLFFSSFFFFFSVSIINRTLTWTTGSLMCAQMFMHAVVHGNVQTPQESLHWKLTLGEKSFATMGNHCVSGVPVQHSTNLATSAPLEFCVDHIFIWPEILPIDLVFLLFFCRFGTKLRLNFVANSIFMSIAHPTFQTAMDTAILTLTFLLHYDWNWACVCCKTHLVFVTNMNFISFHCYSTTLAANKKKLSVVLCT